MIRFGYNDFVKLLLCIVVPILLIVMLVNFIRYYKQKKNNNIIGDEKKWIYICAVVIDIILFLNISTFLEFSATLLLFAIIGILLIISMGLRINEKENLSIVAYLIATIYLIYIIIHCRVVWTFEQYGISDIIGLAIRDVIFGIPIGVGPIFFKSTIKYLCKNDELYRKKFYITTTILAGYTYIVGAISIWREKEEFLITFLAIPIICLIVSTVLNKVNKKRIANIIYFCTIICIFGVVLLNTYDNSFHKIEIGNEKHELEWQRQVQKRAFNSEFEAYEGTQKGSVVKMIISAVITSNFAYEGKQDDRVISVKVGTSEAVKDSKRLSIARSQLVAGKTYTVSFDYNEQGYIYTIIIVEK